MAISIRLTEHLIKFVRVYTFAEDVTHLLSSGSVKYQLLIPKIQILEEVMKEYNIEIEKLPPELQKQIPEIVETQKKEIEGYSITIINQSLSILCSLFEDFLIESLGDIFISKNESIIGLSEQKNITLSEIIKYGSYENTITYFKDKVLRAFSRASTEDQFKKYFGPLGFDVSKFFDMSRYKENVQTKFKGWDLDKLIAIFKERHDIVHNGEKPLNSLDELNIRRDFFEKIVLNIAIELNIKFGILNNLNLPQILPKK